MQQAEIHQTSQQIATLLTSTFNPDKNVRKAAEETLLNLETSGSLFGLATLYLTRRAELDKEIHIAAAIAFKNYIRRHWRVDNSDENSDQVNRIDPQQRDLIKQNITKFMLESPEHIQRQLSEAITIIGQNDFPDRWPTLVVELETYLRANLDVNYHSLLGILQTAHSISRRYRYAIRADSLWAEIKLVVERLAQPLTDRFKELVATSKSVTNDPARLTKIYQSLLLCTKIYQNLITQDLPEQLEDRINDWLPLLLELLNVQEKLPDDASAIEDMKSEICEIASLLVQKYSDVENFKEYSQKFAENIWNLLVTTDQNTQYDILVSTAIRYLVTVAERPESRSMFQDDNVMNLICQRVIIPNFTFRKIDEEVFEDDPEEYVKRDIEGSDVDTRRRAACDLVRALGKHFEAKMISIFGRYIEEMLKSYEANKAANWKHKDLAIFLYSSMAIKGSTRQHDIVSVSEHVNIEQFLETKVVDELNDTDISRPGSLILKASALRYITIFRHHIGLNTLVMRLPLVVRHITSNNVVVRTYAAITLEKLLTMRDPSHDKSTAFKPEQLEPYLGELVKTLFDALDLPGSPENEHIMRAIMRLFSFAKSNLIIQFLPSVVPKMTQKLGIVAANPSKPYFNHYLFETLALLIRASCSQESPTIRDQFEGVLFNIFELVLSKDVQEFVPYVLQLLNLILRAQPVGAVSDRYINLFQELLSPALWEKPANTRPLTELMHTYIEKINQTIISQNKLIPLLGIFQKLIASKATDHEGLALLQTMMIHMPANELDSRIKDVFLLIFQRLTGSKTTKFVKHVLVCFSLYAYLRGPDLLASAVNQLQDKIFGMVLEKLYIADVKKVTGQIERRICMCGLVKIVSHLPLIDNGAYNHLWGSLLLVLMETFELPPEATPDDDTHFIDISESLDFQAQYSKLNYANVKRDDPTMEVGDLKIMLATSLANLSTKLPGFVPKALQENLDQRVATCLMKYCEIANVTIS